MRSHTFRRPPRAASTGIVAIPGGVIAYHPQRDYLRNVAPYAAQRLTFDGRWSLAKVRDEEAGPPLAAIGGNFGRGPNVRRGRDDLPNSCVLAKWGMRYPNVNSVGRAVNGAIVFLWYDNGFDRWSRFCPWQAAPIVVSTGPRGGVVWRPADQAVFFTTLDEVEEVVPDLGLASMLGRFPGSLLAVTPDGTGVHYLRHTGLWRCWNPHLPSAERLTAVGSLAPPPGLRHSAPSDLQVSADGRRLFVAWSGKGVDNVRKGCAVGVYNAATGATEHIYTFPACLLAPSQDGLTLSFLNDFADEEETTLYQIDLD